MNATTETTQLTATNVKKEKSTSMWRTLFISTLFGVGILFSLSLFFSNPKFGGRTTGHSTNLVRAKNNELSLLGNKDVSGTHTNKFYIHLYKKWADTVYTLSNTNNQFKYDISTGKTFGGFSIAQREYPGAGAIPYISVVADRHKTGAVAKSFTQKSAINNIATRMWHTGKGGRYPDELNFWVQFDTLDFAITNGYNYKKSKWTILNFVSGQGSYSNFNNVNNNWWFGAPSCKLEKNGLACETTTPNHYLLFSFNDEADGYDITENESVEVYCRVGTEANTRVACDAA